MGPVGVLFVGRAPGGVVVHDDEGGAEGLPAGRPEHVLEAGQVVCADLVVVPDPDEIVELEVRGEGGDFGGDSYETMVPGHLVARIIGPGGQMIKALMGETGVKMVIIQDSSGFKKEKPLRITGPPDKIRAAKRRIEQVISEEQEKIFLLYGRLQHCLQSV